MDGQTDGLTDRQLDCLFSRYLCKCEVIVIVMTLVTLVVVGTIVIVFDVLVIMAVVTVVTVLTSSVLTVSMSGEFKTSAS